MSVAPDFLVQIYYTINTNLQKLSDHIATLNSVLGLQQTIILIID